MGQYMDMSRYNAPDAPDDSRESIVWETFDTIRIMVRGGLQPSVAAEKLRSLAWQYSSAPDALDVIDDAHDMYCDWIMDRAVSLGL